MACGREKIGNALVNGILHPAGSTADYPFENLLFVLRINVEREISLADRTAENIHK
jgi:hypothetical protein